jgi:hypothetical protein
VVDPLGGRRSDSAAQIAIADAYVAASSGKSRCCEYDVTVSRVRSHRIATTRSPYREYEITAGTTDDVLRHVAAEAQLIGLVNGASGVGKAKVARRIVAHVPNAVLFDPAAATSCNASHRWPGARCAGNGCHDVPKSLCHTFGFTAPPVPE